MRFLISLIQAKLGLIIIPISFTTAHHYEAGLVYWGLTPQQQPGSYQNGRNDDDEISYLVEETGVPGGNQRITPPDN